MGHTQIALIVTATLILTTLAVIDHDPTTRSPSRTSADQEEEEQVALPEGPGTALLRGYEGVHLGSIAKTGGPEEGSNGSGSTLPDEDETSPSTGGGGGGGGGGSTSGSTQGDPDPEQENTTTGTPECLDHPSLKRLVACLVEATPREIDWSDPTPDRLTQWSDTVRDLLDGKCPETPQGLLDGSYVVSPFIDEHGDTHCVLTETERGKTGWGTVITRSDPTNRLAIQVPYPLFARDTGSQGVGVYQETGAWSLTIAGTHRDADPRPGCQEKSVTDVTSGCTTPFHATTIAHEEHAQAADPGFTLVQFLGMAASTCPGSDIHLSDGTDDSSKSQKVSRLREALEEQDPTRTVTISGEPGCGLDGRTNIQGRLLNGVDAGRVATEHAERSTDRFLHIIQDPDQRDASRWTSAIEMVAQSAPEDDGTDGPDEPEGSDEPDGPDEPEPPALPDLPECLEEPTVAGVVRCTAKSIPREIQWQHPSANERDQWRSVVRDMLEQGCPQTPEAVVDGLYVLSPLLDPDGSRHCILVEAEPGRLGWGSLVVREGTARPVALQVSHPLYDLGTWQQSLELYTMTQARSLLIAGAHRYADETPGCRDLPITDVSHSCGTFYQNAVQAHLEHMKDHGEPVVAIQFHGMAADSCPDTEAHVSPGIARSPDPDSPARALQKAVLEQQPDWLVTVPGEGDCAMDATTNIQGRLLNGVSPDRVADTFASDESGRFLHIEQNPDRRTAEPWAEAIKTVWTLR